MNKTCKIVTNIINSLKSLEEVEDFSLHDNLIKFCKVKIANDLKNSSMYEEDRSFLCLELVKLSQNNRKYNNRFEPKEPEYDFDGLKQRLESISNNFAELKKLLEPKQNSD